MRLVACGAFRMNDKAMVECSTVGFRSLADGTVRFTVDVEPLNRAVALKAFSEPGTPCVLVGVTQEVAKKEMAEAEVKKVLCQEARAWMEQEKINQMPSQYSAFICTKANYHEYGKVDGEDQAAIRIRNFCGIESRGELDTNPRALEWFIKDITLYRKFVQDKQ